MFSFQQLPKGARVALITNAGGPGIIATDAIERSALKMAEFSKDTIEILRHFLPPMANVYNPIDVLGDAKSDRYRLVIEKRHKRSECRRHSCNTHSSGNDEIEKTAEAICEIAGYADKTIATSFMARKRIESALKIMCQRKCLITLSPNVQSTPSRQCTIHFMAKQTCAGNKEFYCQKGTCQCNFYTNETEGGCLSKRRRRQTGDFHLWLYHS
ncbi:hypothetical protein [Candidatus Kuenenia stuttgartiensis]|uniref:hypothetical protein n=1 Tax=Kuenenia stuttgartiensis TaxID=174633 RepID=UPI0012FEC556|nr:hypothetical protein [Candidatus Kuenenia stuttgartiensis]